MITATHKTVYGTEVELIEINGNIAEVYEVTTMGGREYLQAATYHITKLFEIN